MAMGGILLQLPVLAAAAAYFQITRSRHERAAQEAQEQTRDILKTVREGFFLLDADYKIGSVWSEALTRMFSRNDFAGAQPLLDQVLKGGDEELADRVRVALKLPQTLKRRETSTQQTSDEAKDLAEKSMKAGYLKDALKYLTIAQENDPVDFSTMLKLG